MTTIDILCIATEGESTKCRDQYIKFTRALQSKACQSSSLNPIDVRAVNKAGSSTESLSDKLKSKIASCTVIILVCSPKLKEYLDSDAPSGVKLLTSRERETLLTELSKSGIREKLLGVYLDDQFSSVVPNLLQGVTVLNGVEITEQMRQKKTNELVDVIIPKLWSAGN